MYVVIVGQHHKEFSMKNRTSQHNNSSPKYRRHSVHQQRPDRRYFSKVPMYTPYYKKTRLETGGCHHIRKGWQISTLSKHEGLKFELISEDIKTTRGNVATMIPEHDYLDSTVSGQFDISDTTMNFRGRNLPRENVENVEVSDTWINDCPTNVCLDPTQKTRTDIFSRDGSAGQCLRITKVNETETISQDASVVGQYLGIARKVKKTKAHDKCHILHKKCRICNPKRSQMSHGLWSNILPDSFNQWMSTRTLPHSVAQVDV